MGKLTIHHRNGQIEVLKCGSEKRAEQIFRSKPTASKYYFDSEGKRPPYEFTKSIKKKEPKSVRDMSIEELEMMIQANERRDNFLNLGLPIMYNPKF
jgi:hypothetical protein